MTLQNLLAIRSLVEFNAQREDIQRILTAAERNLADAAVTAISDENRFDAAYKCVMQCAMASLMANGYRTSTSKPGHHQTAIQALTLSVGLDARTVVVLDSLRKQRNINDYDGEPISPTAVEECQRQAHALLAHVRAWLAEHRPDLY
ncbi:DNA-binding protein [Pseudoduganella sp. SL102]|uniref:DNA-binding protein n=1 Tax=Pseudoduganella sp. SL102 TaxID=2995154 RepID=UPI00248CA75A|nr:DNA-binding protein [Pseudoduganella sp. SL102]WBS02307.1 DNA-binding protein [Pseudoduganella sp. SL102]